MKQVTLREYAKLHKLSYFNVMKMVRGKEVKSVTVEENGKEVQYVLIEEEQEKSVSKKIEESTSSQMSLEEENAFLKKEVKRLKVELEKCNKRTLLAL
ncbi:MAG: Unknown protein [uncultured Sulfurovum sp.]|uniref:Uncharacterized protein n=1 Tax=uncultured Sulfurovum sp. TaxID=269237 RepID=A0A6S6SSA3_9BACT|nr:MAG: Unknown protein [uncultured Sulfurovum sp.]